MENKASGYQLKLSCIRPGTWQLYLHKTDETSDYVRIVFGVTEQVGGGPRSFKIMRKYILTPQTNDDPVFMLELHDFAMKNRRVWAAFETVKRVKGRRGTGNGTFVALSPTQSKWRNSIGLTTKLDILPLELEQFKKIYAGERTLSQGFTALLEE